MDIKEYLKTQDGVDTLSNQRVFCFGGVLWQGFKGVAMVVKDNDLTIDEMEKVEDKDGSMRDIWVHRSSRLEGRYSQKEREFDVRRATLRRERNEIRDSMSKDKELGLAPSPEDILQVQRIDARMKKLVDVAREEEIKRIDAAKIIIQLDETRAQAVEPPEAVDERIVCDHPGCGKRQSRLSKVSPKKWLHMHRLGAHTQAKGARKRTPEQILEKVFGAEA